MNWEGACTCAPVYVAITTGPPGDMEEKVNGSVDNTAESAGADEVMVTMAPEPSQPAPSQPAPSQPAPAGEKPSWRGAVIKDQSLWVKWKFGSRDDSPELRFNPIVASFSVLLVTTFVIWCIVDTAGATELFQQAKQTITKKFTWLYIGSQDLWAIVIIAIYFSKYGNMKLGNDDEDPEYPDGSWFAMLFACGVGVGLFFYGVAEPVFHYTQPNRYSSDRNMPDNELAQVAMNVTFFHWGIHSWIVYVIVGLLLAFVTFRKGLPMTMKSCFYPLVGDRIYGWMGDVIDILSIITTLFGVCTSLGLGTMQVNAGLNYIFPSLEKTTLIQVIIIWVITAIATVSVVSGVGMGVRRLSETCFGVGMFLMLSVFFLEDTWFLLNLYCQTIGYYIQYVIQIGFQCDAFELLNVTSYRGEERGRLYEDGAMDGPEDWMDTWTIFYWGWWISWSPFVGMFIAKISRGRTIRQFVNGTLTAPMIYSFLWLTIFGGGAIRNEKIAAAAGTWTNNTADFIFTKDSRPFCCAADPSLLNWNTEDNDWKTALVYGVQEKYDNFDSVEDCTTHMIAMWFQNFNEWNPDEDTSLEKFGVFYNNTKNRYKMAISEDKKTARLSCIEVDDMWFALMYTYGSTGTFLSVVSIFGILLYFVTSSDSGSLVIDIMAANGDQNPPKVQRVFWACLEGATATALLVAGGKEALSALQTASIVTGLPYTIIMCFLCVSLWRGLAMEFGDLNPYGADFKIGIVDPFATWDPTLWCSFIKNIFVTPIVLYNTSLKLGGSKSGAVFQAVVGYLFWTLWITLQIVETQYAGCYAISWVFYFAFSALVANARGSMRDHLEINGNPIEDFFASMFLYPSVAVQLETATEKGGVATLVPMPYKVRKQPSQGKTEV